MSERATYELAARKRLDALIRSTPGESYASVSALIGRNHAYIQQYIHRGRPRRLSELDRRRIARHFDVPESDLGAPAPEDGAAAQEIREHPSGLVLVPHYATDWPTAAGGLCEGSANAARPFCRRQLAALTGSTPDSLLVLTIRGDCMSPTLNDGDEVLVDSAECTPRRDAIFAIRHAGVLQVKRLSVNPITGRVTVRNDNPLYESWPDCDPEGIDILGRVIWAGRRL